MDYNSVFVRQPIMRRVLISLIPICLLSVYLFGLRVLTLLIVVLAAAIITEYIMSGHSKTPKKVSEAVLVTATLFTLTLPSSVPYWVAVVGIVFGVIFAKGVFGGFGKNVFNPALVGRCFIYVSFPAHMTVSWSQPFTGFLGGFSRFSGGVDAITSATPLSGLSQVSYAQLFIGNTPGSIGETSTLLILLAAAYLIYSKTASWKIISASGLSFLLVSSGLFLSGVGLDPLYSILSGGIAFAVVFMATDPITAPSNELAKLIYGVLIGVLTAVIRSFSTFTEGAMFAILIANTFAPLLDRQVKEWVARKKVIE